ncbi:hypothetical protein J2T02_002432 [Chitinophaga terrae (ex Kim and Jung 2007)]|uniref:hypothetical protein n=1 Tax=Chitinophaga terrae (ex Kim and Jung 2007) TaxID=408074 RepID=UPI00277D1D7A|nr:hypothetical protein [Chitinophaga terrae (ex Kim and Jung 2007)]MDQ0107315.1 hypothetical protein [Chitinophaga terrae (ex Kim and Jung 2007)]
MLRRFLTHGVIYASLAASFTIFSAFNNGSSFETYLSKIISPAGKTLVEYNPDRTIRSILQVHGQNNDEYTVSQLPVYENGRIVKTLLANAAGQDGELYRSFEYQADGKLLKVLSYRQAALVSVDSLVYNADGQLATRYFSHLNAASGKLQQDGYQEFSWDKEGNVTEARTFGKQPGYNKLINTSTTAFTYDNKQNPSQQRDLALILDAGVASLSAHNVLSETIASANSSSVITNTWSYAYNAGKFPVKATLNAGLDGSVVKLEWIKLQ